VRLRNHGSALAAGGWMSVPPSFWLDTCGDDLTPRPPLPGDADADVVIVGAGYTGLWTAFHLLRADPALRVVVLEAETAGWGASGRNGGWCSALFATSWSRLTREHSKDAARRMRVALEETVAGIGRWCDEFGVDAHYRAGGTLTLARNPAQLQRLRASYESNRDYLPDAVWLDAAAAAERIAVPDALGATWDPHCATVHPARLARGLARVVELHGGRIYEQTPVQALGGGRVVTRSGTVRAPMVVRATEGYTADLPGERRRLAPIWSLVIATEPIPESVWARLRWSGRETVSDERHLIIYAQRTADRIVLGGRGAPYRFGSGTSGDRGHQATFGHLERELRRLLPEVGDIPISHRWGGVLGVPRDWMPSVAIDRAAGVAWAGGYVGDGVACSALAGQTLADLVLDRRSDLVTLPWVGHQGRTWEPEPLRWLGIRGMAAVMASADRAEARTGRPSRRAELAGRLLGE
jgi:glycine/D-amino acid oxidase-like deaminating enzyme